MKSSKLYIITRENDLLIREIEFENETSIIVKSRFYANILIIYDKSENVFKSENEALRFQILTQQRSKKEL
ncbi:hypothetical protein CHRY9293_01621 [Chryseobacterium potabilaquae]|nr:hypothetical protein CHRY9293_01621 [Chryseobacterium potabilaquae]